MVISSNFEINSLKHINYVFLESYQHLHLTPKCLPMLLQLLMILELQLHQIIGQMHQLWSQRKDSHFYLPTNLTQNTQDIPTDLKSHILGLKSHIPTNLVPDTQGIPTNLKTHQYCPQDGIQQGNKKVHLKMNPLCLLVAIHAVLALLKNHG